MRKVLFILLMLTVIGFLIWYVYQVVMAKREYKQFVKARAEHQKRMDEIRNAPLW